MPTKIGRLSDKYTLSRYSSSMSINENRAHKSRTDIDIALWGGINYDLSKEKFINLSNSNTSSDNNERGLFNQDRGKLNYLAYTQQEINLINKYFNKTKLRVKQFTGDEASESKFKKFSKHSPYIIHLATHGFYLKNKKEKNAHSFYNKNEDLHYKEQSLLYSGLLLAGAQYAWSGKKLPSNVEDGILTADEISRLDLSNTSLVVLSACETALGDIDNTEGVIGLQRAFKNAGVDNIIMSLWPVGDKQTALLMSYFYKYLLDNDNINVSLQKAMNKVKEKYPNPIDWAGFVLME